MGGVGGAEFRGRVHEGSFGVLGPAFKRVFLVGVSGGGNEFGVYRNSQLRRVRLGESAGWEGGAESGFRASVLMRTFGAFPISKLVHPRVSIR